MKRKVVWDDNAGTKFRLSMFVGDSVALLQHELAAVTKQLGELLEQSPRNQHVNADYIRNLRLQQRWFRRQIAKAEPKAVAA
jgi:hypothetical protein